MRTMTTGLVLAALTLTTAACSKTDDASKTEAPPDAAATAPAASAAPPTADALGIPKPKLGKWRMTSQMPDLSPATTSSEICYTPEMVANADWASQKPPSMDCSGMRTTYAGGVISSQGVCTNSGRKMTFDVRTTGDFTRRYTVESTTLIEPAPPGLKNPLRMKMTAEWVGPCD